MTVLALMPLNFFSVSIFNIVSATLDLCPLLKPSVQFKPVSLPLECFVGESV